MKLATKKIHKNGTGYKIQGCKTEIPSRLINGLSSDGTGFLSVYKGRQPYGRHLFIKKCSDGAVRYTTSNKAKGRFKAILPTYLERLARKHTDINDGSVHTFTIRVH